MKFILNIAVAGTMVLATAACNEPAASTDKEMTTAVPPVTAKAQPNEEPNMAETQVPDAQMTEGSENDPVASNQHELEQYFDPLPMDEYINCHSEKGPPEDHWNGKMIPREIALKHRLYKFNLSPNVQLKQKGNASNVTYKGIGRLEHRGYTILIYSVGINMEAKTEPKYMGSETRMVVLNPQKELISRYFMGGFLTQEGEEQLQVCRTLTFRGNEIVLTLNESDSNSPSHLKLEAEETRDL